MFRSLFLSLTFISNIFNSTCDHDMYEHVEAPLTDETYKNVVCVRTDDQEPEKSQLYLLQLHLLEKVYRNQIEVLPIYSAASYVDVANLTEDGLVGLDVITPLTLDVEVLKYNYVLSCETKANFINIHPHYWDFVVMVTLSNDSSLGLPDVKVGERSNVCRRTLEMSTVSAHNYSGNDLKCFILSKQETYDWFYCLIKKLEFGKSQDPFRCGPVPVPTAAS